VAQVLIENGWKNVRALSGGFDGWQNANLPLEPK